MADGTSERQPRRRLPPWTGELATTALANAIGTLVAGLILFLGGVALGAIDNVSTGVIVGAALLLVGLVGMIASGIGLARTWPLYRRARERLRQLERPIERARVASDRVEQSAGEVDVFKAKMAGARRALERGDAAEADRLMREVERGVANVADALAQAERYIAEADRVMDLDDSESEDEGSTGARRWIAPPCPGLGARIRAPSLAAL